MPKVRARAEPTSDGYQTAMSAKVPPRDPTAVENERDAVYRALMDEPARAWVWELLGAANDLGLDTDDPAVIRSVLDAARKRAVQAVDKDHGTAAWSALRSAQRERKKHTPVVYYARTTNLVKIGTTTRIGARMSSLAVQAVMAIEVGGCGVEGRRHLQFAHLHDHGEWFRLEADLGRHIADVREAFADEVGRTTEEWLADWLPRRSVKSFVRVSQATPLADTIIDRLT